jgi:hypothetical protein
MFGPGAIELPEWHRELIRNSPMEPRAQGWHWTAQVVGYVFRLNAWAQSDIQTKMKQAGIPASRLRPNGFDVAVHIRHGDKRHEMTLVSNGEFVRALRVVEKVIARRLSVFLLTDDDISVRTFRALPGIDLYYLRYPYRGANNYEALSRFGTKAVMYALADVWISCHAAWQIGTWMSHIDRMILEMKSVVFGRTSDLSIEMERPCLSVAHCHSLNSSFDYLTSELFK